MIKAKINNTEVRLLKNGSFRCADPELLEMVEYLSVDYDDEDHGYLPDKQWHRMYWIAKILGGKITHYDEDKTVYPPDTVFSASGF